MNRQERWSRIGWGLAAIGLVASAAFAGDTPYGCYDAKLPAPDKPPIKELFVLVDQTVLLDDGLKQSVANQIRPFLVPGHGISILVFSAYTQGRYTQLLATANLDHALSASQRGDVSKPVLAKHDLCMGRQPSAVGQLIGAALRSAFAASSGDIAKSDVLASMKDISGKVRQSKAGEKVVLVVSDMLENSSVSSFYASQLVRKIDPEKEIRLAQENRLFGDFGNARVYVIGAGLLNNDGKHNKSAYRDPKTMQALGSFWQSYFEKSNARLVEFGQPALLNPVQ